MTMEQKIAERPNQAVFSVCMDEADVAAATSATLKVSGAHFAGEFRDYITADKRPQFSPSLNNAAACVALIDFDRDPELALQTTERLRQIFLKKISIVAVGTELDTGILLRAMRNGCAEFLLKPLDSIELANSLGRFHSVMAVDPQAHSGIGRVIAFFGAKGGVGTTVLAVHLATYLARQHGKKTLLIDHKQQLGHIALYLGLKETKYHFDELLRNADHLDAELLNGFVMRHRSGLDIIASPELVKTAHELKSDQLVSVMDFLRREYDYVLIDSSVAVQDSRSSVIDQADEVYIVSTPDVASLRDLARMVENLSLTESAISKLNVVVNRSTSADSITPEEVEKAVRFPVTISIPNNYSELQHAINEGEPVSPQKRSEFNQAMARWAERVVHGVGGKVASAKKKRFALFG
ncbi:MAG TPA: AAA family ATPase [Acidobacteriaceae bacterium]|nr:AAA family ATPase [Acidobacteriaceae bacterium]